MYYYYYYTFKQLNQHSTVNTEQMFTQTTKYKQRIIWQNKRHSQNATYKTRRCSDARDIFQMWYMHVWVFQLPAKLAPAYCYRILGKLQTYTVIAMHGQIKHFIICPA